MLGLKLLRTLAAANVTNVEKIRLIIEASTSDPEVIAWLKDTLAQAVEGADLTEDCIASQFPSLLGYSQ